MPYVHVLQLLHAEIARLQHVRELLLPSLPTNSLPNRTSGQTQQSADTAALALQASTPAPEPSKPQLPVTVKYVPARRERASKGRRGPRNKSASPVGNTAFHGPVPNGPVYVSADKLRTQQQKQETDARKEAPGEVFTAEQLSRLWLRPAAN